MAKLCMIMATKPVSHRRKARKASHPFQCWNDFGSCCCDVTNKPHGVNPILFVSPPLNDIRPFCSARISFTWPGKDWRRVLFSTRSTRKCINTHSPNVNNVDHLSSVSPKVKASVNTLPPSLHDPILCLLYRVTAAHCEQSHTYTIPLASSAVQNDVHTKPVTSNSHNRQFHPVSLE